MSDDTGETDKEINVSRDFRLFYEGVCTVHELGLDCFSNESKRSAFEACFKRAQEFANWGRESESPPHAELAHLRTVNAELVAAVNGLVADDYRNATAAMANELETEAEGELIQQREAAARAAISKATTTKGTP